MSIIELTDMKITERCPMCKELVDWDDMIWLDGLCTCPKCYEHRRRKNGNNVR